MKKPALRRVPAGHIESLLAEKATPGELPDAIARKRRSGPVKVGAIRAAAPVDDTAREAIVHGFAPFEID